MQKSRFGNCHGCFWMIGQLDEWMKQSQLLRDNHFLCSLLSVNCSLNKASCLSRRSPAKAGRRRTCHGVVPRKRDEDGLVAP